MLTDLFQMDTFNQCFLDDYKLTFLSKIIPHLLFESMKNYIYSIIINEKSCCIPRGLFLEVTLLAYRGYLQFHVFQSKFTT